MVRIDYRNKGTVHEIVATGHADWNTQGKDIVCAAISILIYTLVNTIDPADLDGSPYVVLNAGNTVVRVKSKKTENKKITGIFSVINNGFKILSQNYPKNILFFK